MGRGVESVKLQRPVYRVEARRRMSIDHSKEPGIERNRRAPSILAKRRALIKPLNDR